jgi:UDP-glucose 4-epimerase
MRIVLTGSSGRIGRAIFDNLALDHDVIGIDRKPSATTHIIGDFTDQSLLERTLEGVDAVIHTAALHAPHVGVHLDGEFERTNVEGTGLLADVARRNGVCRIVFTSTTAVYGTAIVPGRCAWVDEQTQPEPRTIYHRTKLAAERLLETTAGDRLSVRVIRMSRCFPEAADLMAVYRLHRGIDARDVAAAHLLALLSGGPAYERYLVSGTTPFTPADCEALATDAAAVLIERVPELARMFRQRGWRLPTSIDRVYAPIAAETSFGWKSKFGFDEVLALADRGSPDVLPVC